MANEDKTPKYLEDIVTYQYADVAMRLTSHEETAPLARGALEKLLEQMDPKSRAIADGFVKGAFASEEGNRIAIETNVKKYQEALGALDATEFYNLRLKTLTSLIGDEKANEAKAVFEKYKGQTVGSIRTRVSQANAMLKDNTGLFDDKKKEEAKATVEKLGYMAGLFNLLEQRNYEDLMPSATKSGYKELITEALKKA